MGAERWREIVADVIANRGTLVSFAAGGLFTERGTFVGEEPRLEHLARRIAALEEQLTQARQQARDEALEEAAGICEARAGLIRRTSAAYGLTIGDPRAERLCVRLRDDIRALKSAGRGTDVNPGFTSVREGEDA